MKKAEKPFVVSDLAARIKDAKSLVVVDYQGLSVRDLEALRKKILEAGGKLVVVKNTLLKLAFGKDRDDLSFEGPTAVVFAEGDEIAPLQVLGRSVAELEKPRFKFGIFGEDILDSEKLLTLSLLPGRNVLLGQLLGTVVGPKYALVGTLNANLQKLVYVLNAKAQGGEG